MKNVYFVFCCVVSVFLAGCFSSKPVDDYDRAVEIFNGKDLSGWQGFAGDPYRVVAMSPEQLSQAQEKADEFMLKHWTVLEDGVLYFDGKAHNIYTEKHYKDFILFMDWKIEEKGDSGVYLKGFPQVQIWDGQQNSEGSGGLWNNQISSSKPLVNADNPVGQWNTFKIIMIDNIVTVYLNDVLVVDEVPLENYFRRGQPLPETGRIELQSHGDPLYFRNIRILEL